MLLFLKGKVYSMSQLLFLAILTRFSLLLGSLGEAGIERFRTWLESGSVISKSTAVDERFIHSIFQPKAQITSLATPPI